MNKLLDGGSGYVNLYTNDLFGLEETIRTLNLNQSKSDSKISINSMSCSQYESSFSGMTSFGCNEEFKEEEENPSNTSPISYTMNSLAGLSTGNALAPENFSIVINSFVSEIAYSYCRTMERELSVPSIDNFIKESLQIFKEHESFEK